MARAGYCSECNANVWLNVDGSCANGHPAACVSGAYEAQAQPAPVVPQKSHAGLIIGIVVAALVALFACGIIVAIAVPVFFNASGNAQERSCWANQRVVMGAGQLYLAMNEDATLPADWDGLMSVLVPSIVKSEPTCPAGGVYSATTPDDGVTVSCSIHGIVPDELAAP